ncbi:MAG: hypothetical protein K2O18_09660 [Oscillospiraceae bacterium]|nr:hypothetical protein [Oscillospiraceae bacterium]
MDNNPITRAEHDEFARRMDSENQRLKDEDTRQNKRLDQLEKDVREMSALATSVNKLATNMESMVKIQEQQGTRLATLESRDGDMWRKVLSHIATTIAGAIVMYALIKLGLGG